MRTPRAAGIGAIVSSLATLATTVAIADQTKIASYGAAEKHLYGLYAGAGARDLTDVHCGIRFKVDLNDTKRPTDWLSMEHAYAADWMADRFGCANRTDCRAHPNPKSRARFNHAEGDLHNLWPAITNLNSARGKRLFGEIAGAETREIDVHGKTFARDFQPEGNYVEPRRIVRGNFARSIFYMCAEYGFPVDPGMMKTLKAWNRDDPPTNAEKARAEKIFKIQGTRNHFIENPPRADSLTCGSKRP